MLSLSENCTALAALWQAPERLPLSQWARKNFRLSSDYSATSGEFEPWGWQVEPLDAFTDPDVNLIVLMTSTQMLKTILMQIGLAYAISEEPGPILFAEPTDEDAGTFSKERLAPMIRDNPKLSGQIAEAKSRDSGNTISSKLFNGGSLALVGSNAPGNFARRTIRYLFCDEIDKYKTTAEGDQIRLGIQRTMQYGSRRKIVLACSPTVDGRSKIQRYYDRTDQRKPWVPCPHCGEYQILKWHQVRWVNDDPRTAKYHCAKCDEPWTEVQRWEAADKAEWIADAPEVKARGYWISHLYSRKKYIAGTDPDNCLAADFLISKHDPAAHQVFKNTSLAEFWREEGERPAWETLRRKAEEYPCNEEAVVPMAASILTAAVDFQKDWIQIELKAWGRGQQSWSMGIWKVQLTDKNGSPLYPSDRAYRDYLSTFLQREWPHESGSKMPIYAMACDTGNNADQVYEFAKTQNRPVFTGSGVRVMRPRTVVCVKGDNSKDQHEKIIVKFTNEDKARQNLGLRIVHVGGGFVKTRFYDSLRLRMNEDGTFPMHYCHIPMAYTDDVMRSFCSEERVVHSNDSVSWEKVYPRNEALDNHVYNVAAAAVIGIPYWQEQHWLNADREFGIIRAGQSAPASPVAVAQIQEKQPYRSSPSWFGDRRKGWMNR